MADLTITAASVVAGSDAQIDFGTRAGAAITAGQAIYKDSSNTWQLADCDGAAALRVATHIALNGGATGQPIAAQKGGDITIGATLTPGVSYYLSATAGGIAPFADLSTGDYPQVIGVAKSASVLTLILKATGTVLA